MENKKEQLNSLIRRNDFLEKIVFVGFNTEKELLAYREKIKSERDEYYDNQEKIKQLKYELMTPKEKEEYDEFQLKLKLKAEGKKFW